MRPQPSDILIELLHVILNRQFGDLESSFHHYKDNGENRTAKLKWQSHRLSHLSAGPHI